MKFMFENSPAAEVYQQMIICLCVQNMKVLAHILLVISHCFVLFSFVPSTHSSRPDTNCDIWVKYAGISIAKTTQRVKHQHSQYVCVCAQAYDRMSARV